MKIITGIMEPDSGYVEIGPTVKIGFFMQENKFEDESLTVLDYVKAIGEYVITADGRITASQMCEKFLFNMKMQWTPITKLSGGEKRRLYLLSVLMESPNVLILDEPTNDLDIETLEILEDYLDKFAGIVITVSHDRYFLDRVVDRIFAFEDGGVIKQYEGGFSDYYEKSHQSAGAAVARQAAAQDGKPASVRNREHEKKLKFTFAEQKEFETIDDDIANLEQKIADIDMQIEKSATQYSKLSELMSQKTEYEQKLSDMMDRWVYLNDLNERINNEEQRK